MGDESGHGESAHRESGGRRGATGARVITLTAIRRDRPAARSGPGRVQRWRPLLIVAAILPAVFLLGRISAPAGIADREGTLTLSPALSAALDTRLSGEPGAAGIALSFRGHDGAWCRSFLARHVGGVACRAGGRWQIRYAAPVRAGAGGLRLADPAAARLIAGMIAGSPLDPAAEREAVAAGWR